MIDDTLVSIIVPVYNSQKCLENCIDSLIAQNYKNFEIILVDDGSDDKSGEICDKYKVQDKRIRVFHKANGGVSSARNLGIKESRGKYFVCVDSDDYVEVDYISVLIETRKKFPEAGHIWCGFQTVTDYRKSDGSVFDSQTNTFYGIFNRNQIMTLGKMWLDTSPCTRLYDREIVISNDLFMDEDKSLGEDMIFNYKYLDLVSDTTIIVVNKPLYNYVCVNNNSLDHKYREDLLQLYQSNNAIISEYLEKWKVDNKQWEIFWNSIFYKYERIMRNTMSIENRKSFLNKIKYNDAVLRSDDFHNVYRLFSDHMHFLYRLAYGTKRYFFVYLVEKIIHLKNRIMN